MIICCTVAELCCGRDRWTKGQKNAKSDFIEVAIPPKKNKNENQQKNVSNLKLSCYKC